MTHLKKHLILMAIIYHLPNCIVCILFFQYFVNINSGFQLVFWNVFIRLALDRITSDLTKRPRSNGSSSGCCSDSYDPLPNQHLPISKESYDVPRPINTQVTPSSSISSLSTGGICSSTSGSESNRSSITPDYDVPKNRILAALPSEFQNLSVTSQVWKNYYLLLVTYW